MLRREYFYFRKMTFAIHAKRALKQTYISFLDIMPAGPIAFYLYYDSL